MVGGGRLVQGQAQFTATEGLVIQQSAEGVDVLILKTAIKKTFVALVHTIHLFIVPVTLDTDIREWEVVSKHLTGTVDK